MEVVCGNIAAMVYGTGMQGESQTTIIAGIFSMLLIALAGLSFILYHFMFSPDVMKTRSDIFLNKRRMKFDGLETPITDYMPCKTGDGRFEIDGLEIKINNNNIS